MFILYIVYIVKCEDVKSLKDKDKEIETGNIRVCIKGVIFIQGRREDATSGSKPKAKVVVRHQKIGE